MNKFTSLSVILLSCLLNTSAVAGNEMERADVYGQGVPGGDLYALDGARLVRMKNKLIINIRIPTPLPGSYMYPPGNPWNNPAIEGKPEAFTLWAFVFNDPSLCMGGGPGVCNGLDARPPLSTQGAGAFNVAGHFVAGQVLQLNGTVTFNSTPFGGDPLTDPLTAEVHLAIAPHGAVQPETLPNQLQTPIGGPDYWWGAVFLPTAD